MLESGNPDPTSSYIKALPTPESVTDKLKFKRAFWIIAISIFVMQVYSVFMFFSYEFDGSVLPDEYYYRTNFTILLWYILTTLIIIWDISRINISPLYLFKLELKQLAKNGSTVLKYFSGCALTILAFEYLFPFEPETVNHESNLLLLMSFFMTVIVAPVCEEIAFRGYLYNAMIPVFKREKERLVVNAMLFSSAHIFLVTFFMGASIPYYIFVIGYLLAKLYDQSRSIVPCIALHALNNGFVFAVELYRFNS